MTAKKFRQPEGLPDDSPGQAKRNPGMTAPTPALSLDLRRIEPP
jgi:hypothetical protein